MTRMKNTVRRNGLSVMVVAAYIGLYVANVRRDVWTMWMGGGAHVSVDYHICPSISVYLFYPLHLMDSCVVRRSYWQEFPDVHPMTTTMPPEN